MAMKSEEKPAPLRVAFVLDCLMQPGKELWRDVFAKPATHHQAQALLERIGVLATIAGPEVTA
jgi:hypothetical protein